MWTIFIVLLVLWLLGLITSNTMNGFLHLLLALAIGVLIWRLIRGNRAL